MHNPSLAEPLVAGARLFSRNVDWNLFLVFHEIVRCGSISGAARALNRQQPSISGALKRLEDHLETELCVRGSHGIELTPAGRAVHAHCEQLLVHVRAVPHDVAKAVGMVEGIITIRTISNLVSPELDAALERFHSQHPGVELKLEVAPWRSVVRSLIEGDVELGIACDDAMSSELRYEPLMRETQQVYCHRNHVRFGLAPVRPVDLVGERFVLTGEDEPSELATFRRRHGLGQRIGGFAETLHEVQWLIELGVGIGFLPTVIAEPAVRAGKLWPLLPAELLPSYHVYVITRAHAARNTPTELILEAILAETRSTLTLATGT
jgi:LysR family transcriptional regulator, transcriptional activator for bauABCD operon